MTDIFRLKKEDGTDGNWAYFSNTKGDIVDAGTDETEARRLAEDDSPTTTIASALANDTPVLDNHSVADSSSPVLDSGGLADSQVTPPSQPVAPVPAPAPEKPKRPPLSPAFLKKIVEQLGRNTTNMSLELERFLIKQFGFTTEELAEDDPDVEIIKMGWDCMWQSYLAGAEPPIWVILTFGYSCATVRLISSAKKIKQETP
jgi:hypothetical protein